MHNNLQTSTSNRKCQDCGILIKNGEMVYIRYGKNPLTVCYDCYKRRHIKWKEIRSENLNEKEILINLITEQPQKYSVLAESYGKIRLRTLIRQLIRDGYNVIEQNIESGYEVLDTIIKIIRKDEKVKSFSSLNDELQFIVTEDFTYNILLYDIFNTCLHLSLKDLFSNCSEIIYTSIHEVQFKNDQYLIRFYDELDDAFDEPLANLNIMQLVYSNNDILLRLYGPMIPDKGFLAIYRQITSLDELALDKFIIKTKIIFESVFE